MSTTTAKHPETEARLLSTNEVARLLGLEPRTLRAWRSRGIGPDFVRLSRQCVRYRQTDVSKYIDARARQGDAP